jgi:hypothetical protein
MDCYVEGSHAAMFWQPPPRPPGPAPRDAIGLDPHTSALERERLGLTVFWRGGLPVKASEIGCLRDTDEVFADQFSRHRIPVRAPAPEVAAIFTPKATKQTPIEAATDFLAFHVGEKPAPVGPLMKAAKLLGIKESTLRRAKKALSLESWEENQIQVWGHGMHVEGG